MPTSATTRRRATVFVHGNPETVVVWEPLLAELDRDDVVCLSPPGFGALLAHRFDATMTGYRDWLIARLEAFAEPVDLVGHDWGGAHVLNAVMARPDLVRSWVSDSAAVFHPDDVWHPLARAGPLAQRRRHDRHRSDAPPRRRDRRRRRRGPGRVGSLVDDARPLAGRPHAHRLLVLARREHPWFILTPRSGGTGLVGHVRKYR